VLAPGFAGYWAIVIIPAVAPSGRGTASLVAAGCWMFVFGVATFFALLNPGWGTFLPVAFSVVGLISGLMAVTESNG